MRINLLAFVLISLLPVLFPRIEILLLSRFLQGVTIGAIAVITRATFSDILPFDKLINLGTLIVGVSGLSPIVGPILGGYLQHYFGWKASFCFLSVITFLLLTLIFLIVPETHINRSELKIIVIKKNLSQICKNSLFVGLAALMGVNYSFLIIFNTMGPFLIQTEWKYSAIFYGHIAFCLGCAFLLSSFTCRHYLKKYRIERLFFVVIHSTLACSLILFVLALFFSSSIILTIFSSSIMFFNCGFIFSMSIGKTLSLFRHMAGAAAAMLYTIDITIASLISMLTSFIHVGSFIPMMTIYLLLSIGCTLIYWFIFKTKLNNEEQPRLER